MHVERDGTGGLCGWWRGIVEEVEGCWLVESFWVEGKDGGMGRGGRKGCSTHVEGRECSVYFDGSCIKFICQVNRGSISLNLTAPWLLLRLSAMVFLLSKDTSHSCVFFLSDIAVNTQPCPIISV